MVSRFFKVSDGQTQKKIGVSPLMIGHKFGEFIQTRSRVHHYRKKRQKAQEKKRKEEAKKAGKVKVVDLARIAAMRQKRKSRK